jgi:hypothetical protein
MDRAISKINDLFRMSKGKGSPTQRVNSSLGRDLRSDLFGLECAKQENWRRAIARRQILEWIILIGS